MLRATLIGLAIATLATPTLAADEKPCKAGEMVGPTGASLSPLRLETTQSPPLNVEVEVEVGQTTVSTLRAQYYLVRYTLAAPIRYSGTSATEKVDIEIPTGAYAIYSVAPDHVLYDAPSARVTDQKSGKLMPRRVMFAVKDDPVPDRIVWLKGTRAFGDNIGTIEGIARQCVNLSTSGFRRELVYSGASRGTISLLYREYTDNMARPAFSQELTYDFTPGGEIGFRGARLKVNSATNTSIRFIVLKPLDGN
jgi:hypothetical protein